VAPARRTAARQSHRPTGRLDRRTLDRILVAVDLETTGYEPETEEIVEIGAIRLTVSPDGSVTLGERFLTFADPGRPLTPPIVRLTGIGDEDLRGAPSSIEAVALFVAFAFRDGPPCFIGHNVGFDVGFLERAGMPNGAETLDTAELASILRPSASSYALQRLAADAAIVPDAPHRALDDAITSALVLGHLARVARELPPVVLGEIAALSELIGPSTAEFFRDAAGSAVRDAWTDGNEQRGGLLSERPLARGSSRSHEGPSEEDPRAANHPSALSVESVFAKDGPLATKLVGYEDRPEQRELAAAIERTFADGGALVAEAGTGVGKSIAYSVPALASAARGERVIISTHTLPLQDQLVRKDLPALQTALGTDVAVAVLKGRSNYLCPRRWQILRGSVATREEARIVCKTLVWRTATESGDRAELNLMRGEGELWSRVSANDESCDQRRCKRTPATNCYLQRAREAAADAGIVVVNHALLLHDARMRGALLPQAEFVVIDEAHRLEDVATDTFGLELYEPGLRRDLQRVAHSPAVTSALRDPARAEPAERIRAEVERALERTAELFGALGTLLVPISGPAEERIRVTAGLRASDDRWLPVELAGERLTDAILGIAFAADRIRNLGGDEDELAELEAAMGELKGAHTAIDRGVHDPRSSDIVWLERDNEGALALHVAHTHLGRVIRETLVNTHRAVVFTSATLAVAGSFDFALDRFGIAEIADEPLAVGSPFDHQRQALLVLPIDIALPGEERFIAEAARLVEDVARALDGRTLVLFTSHATLRDAAGHLDALESDGLAVLAQGIDGSRRALLERFAQGRAVLLGTQSFWEGVDLPGDVLRCVVIVRLPFSVPDDPLVQGRAERYDDPFVQFQLPQAALRLRQGFGRLIRTKTDFGAVVLLDRRVVTRDYGEVLLSSLPDARTEHLPLDGIAARVSAWCDRG
jgi:DNA polymerase-3 subunit epsilon/ATP-dependent DNA helicase DinG